MTDALETQEPSDEVCVRTAQSVHDTTARDPIAALGTTPGDEPFSGRRAILLAGAAAIPALAPLSTAQGLGRSVAANRGGAEPPQPPGPAVRLPGFEYRRIATSGATINVATGGRGPPLLLLHGYPQTHYLWRDVAPALAQNFTVVCADLRGYGDSSKPDGAADHSNYSKRAMATDMLEVMAALGHREFRVGGHDRGARVAYRLALDHPAAVTRLALLDIVSTRAVYENVSMALASAYFHWYFLIQPRPLPETLIGGDPDLWLDAFAFRGLSANPAAFSDTALAEYRRCFASPEGIHATCEDYRAGATIDLAHDRDDVSAGRKIACPTLILWGARGVVGRLFRPLETWRDLVAEPAGEALDCGHFLPEERPAETLRALRAFFGP